MEKVDALIWKKYNYIICATVIWISDSWVGFFVTVLMNGHCQFHISLFNIN